MDIGVVSCLATLAVVVAIIIGAAVVFFNERIGN